MKINPTTTALLVIDMQKDFYAEGGSAALRGKPLVQMQALPPKINHLTTHLRGLGAKIVFTKFIFDPARTPQNFIEIKAESHKEWMCRIGTDGASFAGIYPSADDVVIEKFSHDSFAGTNLLQFCDEWNIETIVVTGVRTEICVAQTAYRSFAEGFRTIVVSDLVGTYDNKAETAATILDTLKYASYIKTSQDVIKILE